MVRLQLRVNQNKNVMQCHQDLQVRKTTFTVAILEVGDRLLSITGYNILEIDIFQ